MKLFLVLAFAFLGSLGHPLWAQASLSNDDVVKLVKTGLSEELILNLIDQQGSRLSGDATHLVELKNNGVSERTIRAIVRKNPSGEPLTNYGLIQLAKARFSEGFLLDLVNQQPWRIATDAAKLIELKRVGLGESVIWGVVEQNPPAEPLITDAMVHLAKAGFSRGFITGLLSRQYRRLTTEVPRIVELNESGGSERILAAMIAEPASRELPAGTEITIRLIDSMASAKKNEADEFRGSLDGPILLGDFVAPGESGRRRDRWVPIRKCSGRGNAFVFLGDVSDVHHAGNRNATLGFR
jgi:hypothetical protein